MKTFAFISRHEPTELQKIMALENGVEIEFVGDANAFSGEELSEKCAGFCGAVVVHPAAAMHISRLGLEVGIFENGTRPSLGGKPEFFPKSFVVF